MSQPSITFIGAGLGGLGTAIELAKSGFTDSNALEKADDVGRGLTWLVTEQVVEVLPHGVLDSGGQVHEADVIIYGTGFAATEFLSPMTVTGTGGTNLREQWSSGARAYLGLCMPDFPNLFVVYGPNTNLGGRISTNWPGLAAEYQRRCAEVDLHDLELA
ncbi:MAG: NAD(P)-binding protein [Marmoricola sp.]